MFSLTRDEERLLRSLRTPKKIQDYLDSIPLNFEPNGDTCSSPRVVIREQRAHCIEGAMLAGLALRVHEHPPLVLHLASSAHDFDHVVALFKQGGLFGAFSKTNHAVLRYRDPIYRTVRELAMSYFHEYTDDYGIKTMRGFSRAVNLSRFDHLEWMTSEDNVWDIPLYLAESPHTRVVTRSTIASLRPAHPIERQAGLITEWKKPI